MGILIIASTNKVRVLNIIDFQTFIPLCSFNSSIKNILQLELSGNNGFLGTDYNNIDNLIDNNYIESFSLATGEMRNLHQITCIFDFI